VTRKVRWLSDQVDDNMRDATIHVDWDISSDVSEFTDVVTNFIATLQDTSSLGLR